MTNKIQSLFCRTASTSLVALGKWARCSLWSSSWLNQMCPKELLCLFHLSIPKLPWIRQCCKWPKIYNHYNFRKWNVWNGPSEKLQVEIGDLSEKPSQSRKGCLAVINRRNLQNSATWSHFAEWPEGLGPNGLETALAACSLESKLV